MPEDAEYRIVFGASWRAGRLRWTEGLTAQFLRYHYLPRREAPDSGEWVFCFACDGAALPGRLHVVEASADGLRFGRLGR